MHCVSSYAAHHGDTLISCEMAQFKFRCANRSGTGRFLVEGLLGLNVQPEQRFRMQGPRLCQKIHAHEGLFLTAERVDIRELRRKVFFRGQVLLDVWILLARMAESFCRSSEVPGKNAFQGT